MTLSEPITVLDKRLSLYQAEGAFRSSIDAVLLAAACPIKPEQSLLDLGCGVGTAGLCVAVRIPNIHLTGIDIQSDQTDLAAKSAALNHIENTHFCSIDIREFGRAKDGKNQLFDHIICNPPYNEAGGHTLSPSKPKALAMGHLETTLQDWIDAAHRNLKSGGGFTLIHKADQIDKILLAMDGRFGGVEIIPLWPHEKEAAKRVILRAVKDRKMPAKLYPGLVLHQEDGAYTPAADDVLRRMSAL